jgi:hypothetical protein
MCNHPKVLKNHNYYAPFHEETILQALLYKRMTFSGLPYCYINGLHKDLEFTGRDNLIGPWIKVPSHKEHLLFYHGEKNIEKIKEFIETL